MEILNLIHLSPLVLFLLPLSIVHGYSSGAPAGQCQMMMPQHGVKPQDPGTSPFNITISPVSITNSGTLNVSIVSDPGKYFEGFLLKAVTVPGGKIVGTFKILGVSNGGAEEEDTSSSEESGESGESGHHGHHVHHGHHESEESEELNVQNGKQIKAGAKYLKCAGAKSAVTHTDGGYKTSMAVEWTPSMKYVGEVRMVATVVKGFSTFWVNVQSETVKVSN